MLADLSAMFQVVRAVNAGGTESELATFGSLLSYLTAHNTEILAITTQTTNLIHPLLFPSRRCNGEYRQTLYSFWLVSL